MNLNLGNVKLRFQPILDTYIPQKTHKLISKNATRALNNRGWEVKPLNQFVATKKLDNWFGAFFIIEEDFYGNLKLSISGEGAKKVIGTIKSFTQLDMMAHDYPILDCWLMSDDFND